MGLDAELEAHISGIEFVPSVTDDWSPKITFVAFNCLLFATGNSTQDIPEYVNLKFDIELGTFTP